MTDLKENFQEVLESNGFQPDRISKTADESWLFEFHKDNFCVDVYPDGDFVLLFCCGERDILYECSPEDFNSMIDIIETELNRNTNLSSKNSKDSPGSL